MRVHCALTHTLGVYYILSVGVYSVCLLHRFPKTSDGEQAEVKHLRFFLCSE